MNTSAPPADPAPDSSNSLHGRLLAILAADVAGYSRLMSVDDRGTVAALDAARAIFRTQILAHRGRVIDMAGDSVLAVFDTAVGAVDTALVVQQQLAAALGDTPEDRRMRFRIGIHVGDVIEKDDGSVYGDGVNIAARLEGLAEPGGVTVSRAVQGMVELRVAATFEDIGKQIVKNIAQPVWAYRLHLGAVGAAPAATVKASAITPRDPRLRGVALAGAALLILAAGVGAWQFWRPAASTATNEVAVNPLSILVLPFANQTGDAQKAYIADALTTSITSDLSRIRDAFIVPATTAFAYKDKPLTVKQVAADAAVRFLLQGSVQSTGDKLRVSAQLLDSQTGLQLWNESFDGEFANLFALQDRVTTRIGNSIGPEMVIVAARESETRKSSPKAADLMLRARALRLQPQSVPNFLHMEALYREVLAQEPNNAAALAGLAGALGTHAFNFLGDSNPVKEKQFEEVRELALKAKAIDPANPAIYHALGAYASSRNDFAGSKRYAETRLALEPKNPSSYSTLALSYYYAGDPEKAITLLKQGFALYPKDNGIAFGNLSRCYLMLGDNDAAIAWGLKALDADNPIVAMYAILAMAYSNKGDTANAAIHAAEYRRRVTEDNFIEVLRPGAPAAFVKYWNERYVPEWKKAGLPE